MVYNIISRVIDAKNVITPTFFTIKDLKNTENSPKSKISPQKFGKNNSFPYLCLDCLNI